MTTPRTWRCKRCGERKTLNEFDDIEREFDRAEDRGGICDACETIRNAPVKPLDVRAVFAPGGPLSGGNPAYEVRPGQVKLAEAVWSALEGGSHLIAEGPCGIGKSKAYGVPASYFASQGKKVLIVTASIALQEQLVTKDLPDLARELPWAFTFALLKGRSNYACKVQLEGDFDSLAIDHEYERELEDVLTWTKSTEFGDRSELPFKPTDAVWSLVSTTSDECPGSKCALSEECFAMQAKNRAAASGIIVTNYHMFFLDRALGGQILPAVDAVIFDEAHEAADVARDTLGFRLSRATFNRIAKRAERRGRAFNGKAIRAAADDFFGRLLELAESPVYKSAKILRDDTLDVAGPALFDAAAKLRRAVRAYLAADLASPIASQANRACDSLVSSLNLDDENMVYFLETAEHTSSRVKSASLVARYVHPGTALRGLLWGSYPTVVAVSATLTTDNGFEYARQELGADDPSLGVRELIVESPFDFARNSILVVPPSTELPEPNAPEFLDVATRKLIETIDACDGRTLGLFTSNRAMRHAADRVRRHFGDRFRVLCQGDAPITSLVREFKSDRSSVLLGVSSLWTGVDVPGDSLSAVVIDRLPFAPPDDPISIRLSETLGARAFGKHTVPRSILTVRQGVGRLIRTSTDVGAVVLLDRRLTSKGYGSRFLRSLPPMRRVASTREIRPFLQSKGAA